MMYEIHLLVSIVVGIFLTLMGIQVYRENKRITHAPEYLERRKKREEQREKQRIEATLNPKYKLDGFGRFFLFITGLIAISGLICLLVANYGYGIVNRERSELQIKGYVIMAISGIIFFFLLLYYGDRVGTPIPKSKEIVYGYSQQEYVEKIPKVSYVNVREERWKCGYCDHSNNPRMLDCHYCGAPRREVK